VRSTPGPPKLMRHWHPKSWTPQAAFDFAIHKGRGYCSFTLLPAENIPGAVRLAAWAVRRACK
jgi:hypothetical protein